MLRRRGSVLFHRLATEHAPDVWELSKNKEPALRERGDNIGTMQ